MGEGIGNDALLMPFITSANIACGYHAGDEETMKQTIQLCLQHNVAIGAHPSFLDKENFGRTVHNLPVNEIYILITEQLHLLNKIAANYSTQLTHVKPHGALYNLSAKNETVALAIANAVKDFDASLILFGLSGSISITAAANVGLKTMHEVFADRTYQDDGSLTPRTEPNSLIEKADEMIKQVKQMIYQKLVTTVSGKEISIQADTICIHGDGKHAVSFATEIFKLFKSK